MRLTLLLMLSGCSVLEGEPPPPEPEPPPGALVLPEGAELGEAVDCAEPVEGMDRFSDETAARGLDVPTSESFADPPSPPSGATVTASDLDGDGDVDLLLPLFPSWPRLMENDGTGHFTEAPAVTPAPLPPPENVAAVDLDGDRLPELISLGDGYITIQHNEGGLVWGPAEIIHRDDVEPIPRFVSCAFGDLDGDGDLDLFVPVVHAIAPPSDDRPPPHVDLLFRNDGGEFVLDRELMPADVAGHAQSALFTDRDFDGDLDLLVPSEFGRQSEPTAFFRNDGVGGDWVELVNDAPALSADIRVGAMGADSADLNGDGALDYCVSDFGPVRCLLSDGERYVDGAAPMGLTGPPGVEAGSWSSWGVELVDLDADGHLDAAVAAGSPETWATEERHPDMLFAGVPGGDFEDATAESGFGDETWHYGMAGADFDGDGFRDLILLGYDVPPKLLMNRCSAGGWLTVDLVGPESNGEAFGARVRVRSWTTDQVRELHSMRGFNQGPSQLHFGLGSDTYASVEVTWPDGSVAVAENVPLNRHLRFVLAR